MKKYKSLIFLLGIDIILLVLIIVQALKIISIIQQKSKSKYVATLKKNNLVFDSQNLGYFFEPKPNSTEVDNPDWLGYRVKYTYNSDALCERFDYLEQKPKGTYRIISLGASYTFGQYVDAKNNYSEILEDTLNSQIQCLDIKHFEVINLGMRAYDIAYMVERYRKRGVKYNPDLIIWFLEEGNFRRVNEYILPIEENLAREGVPEFDSKTNKYLKNEMALRKVHDTYSENAILDYQRDTLNKFSQYYKGLLILLSFPSLSKQYKTIVNDFTNSRQNTYYFDKLADISNIEDYHLVEGHPNKDGHSKIARDIFEYLLEKILRSCEINP